MGLGKGPDSADTADKCQQAPPRDLSLFHSFLSLEHVFTPLCSHLQACCDAGPSCKIWQFSQHPSQKPDCWIGAATSFNKGDGYISRGRNLPGYKLMVQLSRYIFASIDNFAIAKL